MTDDEFRRLIADYLDTTTSEMAGVELDMAEGEEGYGADHALSEHGVTREEIRQVIFEHPVPEEKASTHHPDRSLLWGSTRAGKDITVAVYDETIGDVRRLTLITAFFESEDNWRKRR